MDIGQNIRKIRKSRKLTQMELADKMGYASKTVIGKVERGELGVSVELLDKYAEALECTVHELLNIDSPDDREVTLESIRNDIRVYLDNSYATSVTEGSVAMEDVLRIVNREVIDYKISREV